MVEGIVKGNQMEKGTVKGNQIDEEKLRREKEQ